MRRAHPARAFLAPPDMEYAVRPVRPRYCASSTRRWRRRSARYAVDPTRHEGLLDSCLLCTQCRHRNDDLFTPCSGVLAGVYWHQQNLRAHQSLFIFARHARRGPTELTPAATGIIVPRRAGYDDGIKGRFPRSPAISLTAWASSPDGNEEQRKTDFALCMTYVFGSASISL